MFDGKTTVEDLQEGGWFNRLYYEVTGYFEYGELRGVVESPVGIIQGLSTGNMDYFEMIYDGKKFIYRDQHLDRCATREELFSKIQEWVEWVEEYQLEQYDVL